MHIVMIKLIRLDYQVDEDVHSLAYSRDIEGWLTQWTVANNFTPICYAYDRITAEDLPPSVEEIQPLIDAAKATLIAKHIGTLRAVFPTHTKIERDYSKDFRFYFEIFMAEPGKPMRYLPLSNPLQ